MKIALNMGGNDQGNSKKAVQTKVLEKEILAAKGGDWNAKSNLARSFTPLIQARAEKRTEDISEVNAYIEAGKEGLFTAAKKYKTSVGADRFNIFALDYIEKSMDRLEGGGGFFSRLFGG